MMFVASNQSRQLLYLSFVGTVRPETFVHYRPDLVAHLSLLSPNFRCLVDLTHLEFMAPDCQTELGRQMDLIAQAGVNLLVRVIPDASKDMGMSIMTVFHYSRQVRVVTCLHFTEAIKVLGF